MAKFWDLLKFPEEKKERLPRLKEKIETILRSPTRSKSEREFSEEDMVVVACYAGLLARVAYADQNIDPEEKKFMHEALTSWNIFSEIEVEAIVSLASEEIEELAGLENHRYCYPLVDALETNKRYQIVRSLFHLAAVEGGVSETESEEIRAINLALMLEHKHFISARAEVVEFLNSLNSVRAPS